MMRIGLLAVLVLLCTSPRAWAQHDLAEDAPYPGPAPTTFTSAQAYANYTDERVDALGLRERALEQRLRPRYFRQQMIASVIMAGSGVVLLAAALVQYPSGHGEVDPERRRRSHITARIGGPLFVLGGLWSLALLAKFKRPPRHELELLRHESYYWRGEARRMHPDRPVGIISRVEGLETLELELAGNGLLLRGTF